MNLDLAPVLDHLDLVADPVRSFLASWPQASQVQVAPIDPEVSDTAAFCERYGVEAHESANCVILAGKRDGLARTAAAVVLATTRADVNGLVRRHLDVRKISFAPMAEAVAQSRMEYGAITPLGLPGWPVLVDTAVIAEPLVVIGAGLRSAKLVLPGAVLGSVPGVEVLEGLGQPIPS